MRFIFLQFLTLLIISSAQITFGQGQAVSNYKLDFSTYLGGSNYSEAKSVAVDSVGSVYIAGRTRSKDFPIIGNVIQKEITGWEKSFIQKFDSAGKLIYSSYLDDGNADKITVDPAGYVYLAGTYHSKSESVTPAAFQSPESGTGVFVVKVDINAGKIIYSARLGGKSGSSFPSSIFVDKNSNVFVVGSTQSTDFPVTPDAFQRAFIKNSEFGSHGFVTKLDASGQSLVYSTFLEGSGNDLADDIAIDSDGNAFVTGSTQSQDFPITADAYQKKNNAFSGDYNAFVTKLNAGGSEVLYSTFVGGSYASGDSIAINKNGNVFVTGISYYDDFPVTSGAFQTKFRGDNNNVFVLKLNTSGTALDFSTFLGGKSGNVVTGMVLGADDKIYLVGRANAGLPVSKDAYQSKWGGGVKRFNLSELFQSFLYDESPTDAFMSIINSSGDKLIYSTYLGGSDIDDGNDIAVNAVGNVYIVGTAQSSKFPISRNAFQVKKGNIGSAFLAKFSPSK